jgi:hypothetical protein
MDASAYRRKVAWLCGMALLAAIYRAFVNDLYLLTGSVRLDGQIGVMLGLYICAHPAANAIDLFFDRGAVRRLTSPWSGVGWLTLNVFTMLAGYVAIVTGVTRVAGAPPAAGIF